MNHWNSAAAHDSLRRPTVLDSAHWRAIAILLGIGSLSLGVGALVYLTDRPGWQAPLVPMVPALSGRQWFGALWPWLPSLMHTLAFSLFSAALLAPQRLWQYGACAFWFAANAAFEVGQHPQIREPLANALREGFGQGSIARSLENFLERGTFDIADLVAAALGATLAAGILRLIHSKEAHHGP